MNKIKNIIFDLGGVILDIDYNLTAKAFQNIGLKNADHLYTKASQVKLFDDLEKGLISENDFFDSIRKAGNPVLTDEQIRNSWNALLIGLTQEKVDMLKELKKNYRLFLLSNTNEIHEKAYTKMISDQYGSFILNDLFEKMYLSHHLKMRKPDAEIFNYVLQDKNLKKEETLFIDDSPQHVEGARALCISTLFIKNGDDVYWELEREIFTQSRKG